MIIDLLSNFGKSNSTIVGNFRVGEFEFDCQLEENHSSRLVVTTNPIESGASISDHSYLEPKTYSVRGLVVGYKPSNYFTNAIDSVDNLKRQLPVLTGIAATTQQQIAKVARYSGIAKKAIDTVSNFGYTPAEWLPKSLSFLGDNTQSNTSRMSQAYETLLTIQSSSELLKVVSNMRVYENMVITDLVLNKGENDAVEIAMSFMQLTVTETQTTSGLVVNVPTSTSTQTQNETATPMAGENKTGRSAAQAATPKSKGKTQPVKQDKSSNKSILKSAYDLFRGK